MPTTLGVGYSLMPSMAPTRVCAGSRYSIASKPKSRRVVPRTSFKGARGSGTGRASPDTR